MIKNKKSYLFLLSLLIVSNLMADPLLTQEHDLSFTFNVPSKFTENQKVFIFNGNIDIRQKCEISSEKIFTLNEGEKVLILKQATNNVETIDKRTNFWFEIQDSKDRKGFIFGGYLTPACYSYYETKTKKTLIFLIGQSQSVNNELRVLENGKLIASQLITFGENQTYDLTNVSMVCKINFKEDFFGNAKPAILMESYIEAQEYPIETHLLGFLDKKIVKLVNKSGIINLIDHPYSHTFSYYFIVTDLNPEQNTIVEVETSAKQDDDGKVNIDKQVMRYYKLKNNSLSVTREEILK